MEHEFTKKDIFKFILIVAFFFLVIVLVDKAIEAKEGNKKVEIKE